MFYPRYSGYIVNTNKGGTIMGILAWIIVDKFAGWIAGLVTKDDVVEVDDRLSYNINFGFIKNILGIN